MVSHLNLKFREAWKPGLNLRSEVEHTSKPKAVRDCMVTNYGEGGGVLQNGRGGGGHVKFYHYKKGGGGADSF